MERKSYVQKLFYTFFWAYNDCEVQIPNYLNHVVNNNNLLNVQWFSILHKFWANFYKVDVGSYHHEER